MFGLSHTKKRELYHGLALLMAIGNAIGERVLLCLFVFFDILLNELFAEEKVCRFSLSHCHFCWFRFSAFYRYILRLDFFLLCCRYVFMSIPLCEIKWNASCFLAEKMCFSLRALNLLFRWWSICFVSFFVSGFNLVLIHSVEKNLLSK